MYCSWRSCTLELSPDLTGTSNVFWSRYTYYTVLLYNNITTYNKNNVCTTSSCSEKWMTFLKSSFLFLATKATFQKEIYRNWWSDTYLLQKGTVLRHVPGRTFCNYSSDWGFVWRPIVNIDTLNGLEFFTFWSFDVFRRFKHDVDSFFSLRFRFRFASGWVFVLFGVFDFNFSAFK